jgi:hypothetical protein
MGGINGHTNLQIPPVQPTMPLLPALETWLNNLGGGGQVQTTSFGPNPGTGNASFSIN